MVRSAIGFGLMAATLLTTTAWARDEDKHREDKYYGTYEFISGRDADGEISKGQLSGTVKVTKDMIFRCDQDGKETHAVAYETKGDKEDKGPHKIDMKILRSVDAKVIGRTAKGMCKHDGETTTLIYDYSEGADYPDNFTPGAMQHLFVLKRTGD